VDQVSEVLTVENPVAFPQNLVPFGAQVEFLTQIAHIKEFLIVFLEESI